jgi:CTP synthase
MLEAIRWAREHEMPFFGICLGLQCAVIEFARNVCGLEESHSSEFAEDSEDPVICLLDSQLQVTTKGGTMRLGAYPCHLAEGTRARDIYESEVISERHRHRFEVNNTYRDTLAEHGLTISGTPPALRVVRGGGGELCPAGSRSPGSRAGPGVEARPRRR